MYTLNLILTSIDILLTPSPHTIRYVHHPPKTRNAASNFMGQNLPMAAMFLRNKPLSWACMFIAIQSYLNEPAFKQQQDESQPAIFRIIFALIAVATSYMDIVFPSAGPSKAAVKDAVDATIEAVSQSTALFFNNQ